MEKQMQYNFNPQLISSEEWLATQDFPQKYNILQSLKHPNIVKFEDVKRALLACCDDLIAREIELSELDALVGLEPVKAEVHKIANAVKIAQARKAAGMQTATVSYHMVFTGNPGTGKTTVARILAKIFRALGVLEKGQLVETDRSGLVAGYQGQTAIKANETIDKAIGGILFIDEAYTLAGKDGKGDSYGDEALATLLKRMEDDRDRLIVIVAGYTDEMRDFISQYAGELHRIDLATGEETVYTNEDPELDLWFVGAVGDTAIVCPRSVLGEMNGEPAWRTPRYWKAELGDDGVIRLINGIEEN